MYHARESKCVAVEVESSSIALANMQRHKSSIIVFNHCLFCNKQNYKPRMFLGGGGEMYVLLA